MPVECPPRFWFELPVPELFRHQEAVAIHMAEAQNDKDKEFYAAIFLDISVVIVAKSLGLQV